MRDLGGWGFFPPAHDDQERTRWLHQVAEREPPVLRGFKEMGRFLSLHERTVRAIYAEGMPWVREAIQRRGRRRYEARIEDLMLLSVLLIERQSAGRRRDARRGERGRFAARRTT